jgi:hypothetical protein
VFWAQSPITPALRLSRLNHLTCRSFNLSCRETLTVFDPHQSKKRDRCHLWIVNKNTARPIRHILCRWPSG